MCDSCVEIRQGNAVDVIEIDAATNRGIDEIRELRDAARYAPSRDRYKIYILDEAHQITEAAFNALLKTLEEPPAHVIFMMATTQPEDIPQTIRSRCQHFSFHAVKFDDILAQLKMIAGQEEVEAEEAALALLAEAGDGSMRDALSIMDQAIASAPTEEWPRRALGGADSRADGRGAQRGLRAAAGGRCRGAERGADGAVESAGECRAQPLVAGAADGSLPAQYADGQDRRRADRAAANLAATSGRARRERRCFLPKKRLRAICRLCCAPSTT